MSAWGMLKRGNIIGAITRVWDTLIGALPPAVQAFVNKILNDGENLLMSQAETAAMSVVTQGLTTAAFTSAAKTMVANLEAQGVQVLQSDAFAALNMAVSAQLAQGNQTVAAAAGNTVANVVNHTDANNGTPTAS